MMTKATLCPLLFLCDQEDTPEKFEANQITLLISHLNTCAEFKITLEMSKKIFEYIRYCYPWHKMGDAKWKQYLLSWWTAVFVPLERSTIFSDLTDVQNQENPLMNCSISKIQEINVHWSKWLLSWRNGHQYRGQFDKGIGSDSECSALDSQTGGQEPCCKFHIISDCSQWKCIRYPWLLMYDSRLPTEGVIPFVPVRNWDILPQAKRGNQYGYLDIENNEWQWDNTHNDHWDVQMSSGGFKRITPDGKDISH